MIPAWEFVSLHTSEHETRRNKLSLAPGEPFFVGILRIEISALLCIFFSGVYQ